MRAIFIRHIMDVYTIGPLGCQWSNLQEKQLLLKENTTKHFEDFRVCNEALGPQRHMKNWKNTKIVALPL